MARLRVSMLLALGVVALVLSAAVPSECAHRRMKGAPKCDDDVDDCPNRCPGGPNCPDQKPVCPGGPDCPKPAPACPGGPNCPKPAPPTSGSCDKPLGECDFFFHEHKNQVPTITLVRNGDNHIYVDCGHIVHQDGPDTRPVQTVNSAHCSLLIGGYWDQHKCSHHIYGNGRHIASRHFPSIENPSHFLNTCIKVQISAAQYKDGGNFNNGHNNPRACIVVKTAGSFA